MTMGSTMKASPINGTPGRLNITTIEGGRGNPPFPFLRHLAEAVSAKGLLTFYLSPKIEHLD